jgi:hypothetical protein
MVTVSMTGRRIDFGPTSRRPRRPGHRCEPTISRAGEGAIYCLSSAMKVRELLALGAHRQNRFSEYVYSGVTPS